MKRRAQKKRLTPGHPSGTNVPVGHAYLYLFPFDIYHTCEATPHRFSLNGARVEVYPPHPNSGSSKPTLPQVQLKNIPVPPNTTKPWIKAPVLKSMGLSLSWAENAQRGDSMRVNWYGPDNIGAASELIDRFLAIARMFTMQWWITRDRRADEGYIRNSFSINERAERLEGVISLAQKYSGFGLQKVMTQDVFTSALWFAQKGYRPLLSIQSLLDAIYHHGVGDMRRMAIDAAIACETVLEEFPRLQIDNYGWREKDIRRAMGRQFEYRLSDGLRQLFGKSFATDKPHDAEWIEAIWIYRNNVAHGQAPLIKHQGQLRSPTPEDHKEMMKAVIELFMWIQQFGKFSPLHAA